MAIKIIKEITKDEFRDFLYNLDIRDKELYKEINNPNSIGIFQMNGNTAQRFVQEVQPQNFEEVNACNALSRPGPIEVAGPYYVARKFGDPSPYPPEINEILKDTYYVPIYQEQIMSIFNKIGGFTLEETNEVRSLMKKLGKADKNPEDLKKWDKVVGKFIHGAQKQNITEKDAKKIADDLVAFSGYSFNRSHSTAYTYIAIMTLYMSVYFRKYYYSAILTYEVDRDKKLFEVMQSVKMRGIEILPPDINKSGKFFSPVNEKQVLFGLNNIKYVGEDPADIIISNRPYNSVIDFLVKMRPFGRKITSRVVNSLISVGCFDSIEPNRKKLLEIYGIYNDEKKTTKVEEKLRFIWDNATKRTNQLGFETTLSDLRKYEKEAFGFNFFTSLFVKEKVEAFAKMAEKNLISLTFEDAKTYSRKCPVCINSLRIFNDKNGNEMAFSDMEDINGHRRSIPIFASYWKYLKSVLLPNNIYLLNLYKDDNDKFLFGQRQRTDNEAKVLQMIRKC